MDPYLPGEDCTPGVCRLTGQVSSTDEAGKASRYQVDRGMPRYQAHMLGYRQKSLAIEQSQLAVTKRMSRDVDYLIHESYSIIHQEFRRGGMILTHPLWRCADRCLASSSTREMPPSPSCRPASPSSQSSSPSSSSSPPRIPSRRSACPCAPHVSPGKKR